MALVVDTDTSASPRTERDAIGVVDRVKRFFYGVKPAVLKEERVHVHWLSLAYMGVMSVFALQVFALQDLQTALSTDAKIADRIQSSLLVTVIIVAVFISDYAAPHARELAKLVGLRGEIGLAWSLRFYALCVYATDGYAVITILYRSVAHLPATTPPPSIGPLSGAWTEVLIRGTLIVFTGWMIHTVTQRQYPTSNTLARRGSELMGGILLNRLATQNASQVETHIVAQWFRAFTEAAKRAPRYQLPRLPFVHDASAEEAEQWAKLVQVMKAVATHPVTTGDPAISATPSPPLALPTGSAWQELIAGVMATWQATHGDQVPTVTQIAAAVVNLGYVRPTDEVIRLTVAQMTTVDDSDEHDDAAFSQQSGTEEEATQAIAMSNSQSPLPRDKARPAPKPGTKAYKSWVKKEIGRIESNLETPTPALLAQRLNEAVSDITPVFDELMNERRLQFV